MSFLRTRYTPDKELYAEALARLGAVYVVRDDAAQRIKIGYSQTPYRRMDSLQVGCSGRLRMVAIIAAPIEVESLLHQQWFEFRTHGEWFDDRNEHVSKEILYMLHGDPICKNVWEMVPGKFVFHEVAPGLPTNWSSCEYLPA